MITKLQIWIQITWNILGYSKFMPWNLFLAFIPLGLSLWLFRRAKRRSILWWIVLIVFIAFLPNAPYVLTDIIHLVDLIRYNISTWVVTLILIPQYVLYALAGFEAYVMSLLNFGYYLHRQNLSRYIWRVELILHALSAIGIYIGRFQRFNSWDIVTKPKHLVRNFIEDFTDKQPLLVTFITFVILVILYWIFKQINLGIMTRISNAKES